MVVVGCGGEETVLELHHSLLKQFSHRCTNKPFFFHAVLKNFKVILDVMGVFFPTSGYPSLLAERVENAGCQNKTCLFSVPFFPPLTKSVPKHPDREALVWR